MADGRDLRLRLARGRRFLILVGHMGAGKSTVGRLLAERLGWEFADLDQEIEREQVKSAAEIFRSQGEAGFRAYELAVFKKLMPIEDGQRRIIALGGGALETPSIRELVSTSGASVVFLDAPANQLLERCRRQTEIVRPLAKDEGVFRKLCDERRAQYEKADFTVQTAGRTAEEVRDEIERWIHVQ